MTSETATKAKPSSTTTLAAAIKTAIRQRYSRVDRWQERSHARRPRAAARSLPRWHAAPLAPGASGEHAAQTGRA